MRWHELAERPMPETEERIDWSECDLVEVIPGKASGAPLLKGTRMPVQTIVDNIDYGMTPAEVAETWELDLNAVLAIWAYAEKRRAYPAR
jgi:uncharacterized protein (DUF433 family)